MQLPIQLPFGILCILFTHYARVTALCPTPPCNENAPVYGVAPPPLDSGAASSTPAVQGPIVSSTSSAPPAAVVSSSQLIIPPGLAPPTSSTSTPILPPTTASSVIPTSISENMLPAAKLGNSQSSSMTGYTVPPSSTTASSSVTALATPSTTASYANFATLNSSASVSVPASITQCGSCRVLADQVQVYYWPTASVKNNCARGASVDPFQTGVPYASNASRIQSLAPQGADSPTTTVVDGHTL